MIQDIKILLSTYKSCLALRKSQISGYTEQEASYQNGEDAMLECVIDDLQRIVDKTEEFLGQ